jgi:hypothetical protein
MSDKSQNLQYKPLVSHSSGSSSAGNQGNPSSSAGPVTVPQSTPNFGPSSTPSNPGSAVGIGVTPNPPNGGGIGGQSGGIGDSSGPSSSTEYDKIISYANEVELLANPDGTAKVLQNHPENRSNSSWITRCDNITIKLSDAERFHLDVKELIDEKGTFKSSLAEKHLERLRNFKSFLPIVSVTGIWMLLGIIGLVIEITSVSSQPIDIEKFDNNLSEMPSGIKSVSDGFRNANNDSEDSLTTSSKPSSNSDLFNTPQSQAILFIWLAMLVIGIGFCLCLWILKNKALSFFKFIYSESRAFDCTDVIKHVVGIENNWKQTFEKSIHQEFPIKGFNFSVMRVNISNAKNIFLKRERDYEAYLEKDKRDIQANIAELERRIKEQLDPPASFLIRKVDPSTRSHPFGEDVYKIRYGGMDFEICSQGVIFDYKEMATIIGSDNPDVLKFRNKIKTLFQDKFSPTCNPYLKNFDHLINQLGKRDKELEANYARIESAVPRLSPDKNGHESAEQALHEITQLFLNHQVIRNRKLDFIEGPETNTSSMGSVFAGGNLSPTAMPGNPNPVQ